MDLNEVGFGKVMPALRLSITGKGMGPSMFLIMELLGKEEVLNRIENSAIKELVLTDSIEASNNVKNTKNIRHISIAPLMVEAIKRINSDSSVSALFD